MLIIIPAPFVCTIIIKQHKLIIGGTKSGFISE